MSDYSEFFLASPSSRIQYETIELSHPSFTQSWRLVRNAPDGLNAGGYDWQYVPMRIEPSSSEVSLDFGITIIMGDLGTIIPQELDAIQAASDTAMLVKPEAVYRTFDSAQLAVPLQGPFVLEVQAFSLTNEGTTFQCAPPTVNRNKTGMLYTPQTFPTLRGFR